MADQNDDGWEVVRRPVRTKNTRSRGGSPNNYSSNNNNNNNNNNYNNNNNNNIRSGTRTTGTNSSGSSGSGTVSWSGSGARGGNRSTSYSSGGVGGGGGRSLPPKGREFCDIGLCFDAEHLASEGFGIESGRWSDAQNVYSQCLHMVLMHVWRPDGLSTDAAESCFQRLWQSHTLRIAEPFTLRVGSRPSVSGGKNAMLLVSLEYEDAAIKDAIAAWTLAFASSLRAESWHVDCELPPSVTLTKFKYYGDQAEAQLAKWDANANANGEYAVREWPSDSTMRAVAVRAYLPWNQRTNIIEDGVENRRPVCTTKFDADATTIVNSSVNQPSSSSLSPSSSPSPSTSTSEASDDYSSTANENSASTTTTTTTTTSTSEPAATQ